MQGGFSVLFVCLGNICRSPLAEAAFRAEAERIGLAVRVASAGTGGWHVGEPPDHRAQIVARRHGVDISQYRGRQLDPGDFHCFTHMVALDRENLAALHRLRPKNAISAISLLLDHVPGRAGASVADPYYGDIEDFEVTWADVTSGAAALAAMLSAQQFTSGPGGL